VPRGQPRLDVSDIEWKAAARGENGSANRVPEHRWLTHPVGADETRARENASGASEPGGEPVRGVSGGGEARGGASAVLREGDAELESIAGAALDPAGTRVPKKGFARRWVLPVCVGLAAAFVAGTGYLAVTEPQTVRDLGRWGATAGAGETVAPQPTDFGVDAGATANPFGPAAPVLAGAPTRLRITAIGIDTALESLHLARGALTPPKNFAKAGWYADGTAPGDLGPAVIAGHVDSKRGPAVFYRLREIQAGDRIEVIRGGKSVRFTVTSIAWYPKTKFPTGQVYGPTPDRQLRLITCGGVFDHRLRSYKDNLVVYAVAG
jgi:Sortase domain